MSLDDLTPNRERRRYRLEVTGIVLIAITFFFWPVPNTIVVRGAFQLAAFVVFALLALRSVRASTPAGLGWPLGSYVLLSAWMIVVALFVSPETDWSLDEIRGQWLKGLGALLTGALIAWVLVTMRQRSWLILALYVALVAHVVVIDVEAIAALIAHAQLPLGEARLRVEGLTEGPDKANYLTNMLLTLVVAEVFLRVAWRRRALPLPGGLLAASAAAGLFAVYATATRNGGIELTVIALLFVALFVYHSRAHMTRRALAGGVAAAIALVAVVLYASVQTDKRWETLMATVPIALDTDTHRAWLDPANHPLPRLPSGATVDDSNYLRIAWFREGVRLVADHPLGIGFGRNAFGHGLEAKYGASTVGHSHSGLLDLAVGIGIPGALLWLGLLASVLLLAARRLKRSRDFAALWLLLVVTGYSVRMLIDSVIRDHMLQQFLFLVGLLAVMAVTPPREESPVPAAAPRA